MPAQGGKHPTLLDIDQRKAANTGEDEPQDVAGGTEDGGAWMRLPEDALTNRGRPRGRRPPFRAITHGHRRGRREGPGREHREADEHHADKARDRVGSPQTEQRCALDLVWVQRNRDKGQAGQRCADTDNPDVEVTPRRRGGHPAAFRPARVFDIARTAGNALPEVVSRLIGDNAASRFAGLVKVAANLGYSVEVSELPGERNGDCAFEMKLIRIREGLQPAQSVKTLAHELAHTILHSEVDCIGPTRSVAELEAESVAFVVCDDLGLDSSAYSFGYIATWAGGGNDADEAIGACAQRINTAARTILELLEASE
jgi:hypothetical protein